MERLKYTPFKVFNFPEKLNSLPKKVTEIKPPLHVRIKPTNICAHKCWYCAYKADDLQLGDEMVERDQIPKEKMFEILKDLKDMSVGAVTFSGGGDPFYYKHLLEVIKWLADNKMKFASLTNGARLKGELAEVFSSHGTWIRISLDGWDDDSYAKYRGIKKGNFTKLTDNLKSFARLNGSCKLGVSFIIDHDNAKHIYSLASQLRDIGVNSVKISPCVVSNDGKNNNQYHDKIYSLVREQIDLLKNSISDDFELFDSYHLLDEKFDKNYDWCPYMQILPIIGADQNIYSCQDKAYTSIGRLGSIKNQSFMEFWNNNKNKFFCIDPSKHCSHHCVSNRKNEMILEYLNADKEHLNFV
jgi:MoaA/NifB/PqqE/SkfB family radical SAM enzyme